jgi:hypothetical protein
MRLIQADDYNDVVDIFISGAAAVDEIAPGVVRVTYFVEKSTGTTATLITTP